MSFLDGGASRLARAYLDDQVPGWEALDLAIHPRDPMLRFALHAREGDRERAVADYFQTAFAVFRSFRQLAEWRFGGLHRAGRLLDFAAGYGRVTRFLARELPPARVTAADLLPEALAFQRERFGVRTLLSAERPEDLPAAGPFDAIFVGSLFTHLPRAGFEGWLGRLVRLLEPGGILAFSAHDASLLAPHQARSPSGLSFEPRNEDPSLDPLTYGSTWVSEAFVAAALGRAAPGASWHRLPRALRHFQDLYLVVAEAGVDFSGLAFDPGPEGRLEGCRWEPAGVLHLSGWAVAARGRPAEGVVVTLDGHTLGEVRRFGPRPDVGRRFGGGPIAAGWELAAGLPEGASYGSSPLLVKAVARGKVGGEVLFLGTVGAALLESARGELEALRREHGQLAMATRRYRALRRLWLRLKGLSGPQLQRRRKASPTSGARAGGA